MSNGIRNEDIAYSFEGVERAYAIQAGREMRVVVLPETFDDDGVVDLAGLTKRIEKEVNFSGKIKITVIREKKNNRIRHLKCEACATEQMRR